MVYHRRLPQSYDRIERNRESVIMSDYTVAYVSPQGKCLRAEIDALLSME